MGVGQKRNITRTNTETYFWPYAGPTRLAKRRSADQRVTLVESYPLAAGVLNVSVRDFWGPFGSEVNVCICIFICSIIPPPFQPLLSF